MDTLPWKKLHPTVEIKDTTKKFFNKFLYKIVVFVPGVRLITDTKNSDMTAMVAKRKSYEQRFKNYGGSWKYAGIRKIYLDLMNVAQLEYWRTHYQDENSAFKFRLEEPLLTVYADSEESLFTLVNNDPSTNSLRQLHRPKTASVIESLNKGEIVVKKDIGYDYRIYLREGRLDSTIAQTIYNILTSQGDSVKMTKSCVKNLSTRVHWFTRTYFYTNDLSIVTMITLVDPNIISGIFKLAENPK